VLYNPHCSPHLSSWFRHGRAILDFFVDNDDYQLIFAPHVMLFERRFVVTVDKLRIDRPGKLDQRYLQSPNIHVDLGSPASTDMSYTLGADIYVGDASSQVYEFLSRPRPCLFIDSHGAPWRGNPDYEHWNAGPVITDPQQLAEGLKQAVATHQSLFLPVQRDMLARSFDISEQPASQRAVAALLAIMDRERTMPPHRRLAA
jgi:hypothetical protein